MRPLVKILSITAAFGATFLWAADEENLMPSLDGWSVRSGKAVVSVQTGESGEPDTLRIELPSDGTENWSWIQSPKISVSANTGYELKLRMKADADSPSMDIWCGTKVYEFGSGWNPPDGKGYLIEVLSGKRRWAEWNEQSSRFVTREETKALFIGILVRGKGDGEIINIQPISFQERAPEDEASTENASTKTISLLPGEGTVLLLGNDKDLKAVKAQYFEADAHARRPYPDAALGEMLFGIYVADLGAITKRLQDRGIEDAEAWYSRLLELLRDSGMNTIYIQGGGHLNKPERVRSFAALCAKYGIQIIVQPGSAYFGGGAYTAWTERQKAAGKTEISYEAFFENFIEPQLDKYLPEYSEETNIFAWSPVEELPADLEEAYVPYKQKIKQYLPNQRIFQLDSQQNRRDRLTSKRDPIPDVFGFDRYVWWHQSGKVNGKPVLSLWTPHFATRWLFNEIKQYAVAVQELYDKPAIVVLQGGARRKFYDANYTRKGINYARHYGWEASEDFFCPATPDLKYHEELGMWSMWSMYMPPENAYRLMSWLGICAGYKGIMLWNSVQDDPETLQKKMASGDVKSGQMLSTAIINYKLDITPQWREFSQAVKEIQTYQSLILHLKQADAVTATSDNPHVFINAFTDGEGRKYLVVVNGMIGEWGGGKSPDWTTERTGLSVGDDGNLTGYTALTDAREITVIANNGQHMYDLRNLACGQAL